MISRITGEITTNGRKQKNRSRKTAVLLSVLCLFLLSGILFALWLRGHFLPHWVHWHDKALTIHTYEPHPLFPDPGFVGTPVGEATLSLSGRTVRIFEDSRNTAAGSGEDANAVNDPAYTSPSGWFISDAAAADITGDGIEEILLLLWKRGQFGGVLPFWVRQDDPFFSEHLYIFTYQDGTLQPMWMASKLPCDAQEFTVTEDGAVRLVTPEGTESFWIWDHWGLKKQEAR